MNYGDVRNGVPFLEFDVPYSSICSKKKNREQYLFATFFPGSPAENMVHYNHRQGNTQTDIQTPLWRREQNLPVVALT